MSNMKNGLSTLNRWLGKKNKAEKDAPNGKLSKSTTNLSVYSSSSNINETSQMEYNRITPLPVVTSNAPFEQTFRITVLLPKDQLYVARLGARVPLSKLMELVSENKLLDADKYEFRNPVDSSQVYNCDLTIGSVGLSEIRLCHKSDPYTTIYNTDDVLKLHRTSGIRDSLSSSEMSSRNLKLNLKTPSPYSSCNSLNSMDSTGNHYTRTPVTPITPSTPNAKILAPPRKKRAAPRPPSQKVIPEKADLIIENGDRTPIDSMKEVPITRKDHFVSTPNLSTSPLIAPDNGTIDCNGNTKINGNLMQNGFADMSYEEQKVEQNNARNLYSTSSVQNLSNLTNDCSQKFPEPSPRKRMVQVKKKIAAPAPPSRNSMYSEDSLSIASASLSSHGDESTNANTLTHTSEPVTPNGNDESIESFPKPAARELVHSTSVGSSMTTITYNEDQTSSMETPATQKTTTTIPGPAPTTPTPIPRQTTTNISISPTPQISNVSKVMLNRTPTPEPRSLSCEPPDMDADLSHLNGINNDSTALACDDDDNVSKQADSGIGEPVPSPTPDSLPSEGSAHEFKSTFESTSSDDDDMVKVYNFKLGKTVVHEQKTLEDLKALNNAQTDSGEESPTTTLTQAVTPNLSETSSWNFSIPISPPPNFADNAKFSEGDTDKNPDAPITPKIKERPLLNFESIANDAVPKEHPVAHAVLENRKIEKQEVQPAQLSSPTSPLNELVDELSAILHGNRMDSLIKKSDEQNKIEAAKPNSLANFSITTISQQPNKSPVLTNGVSKSATPPPTPTVTPENSPDEEQLYRKRPSITSIGSAGGLRKHRTSVSRADSFHTTTHQESNSTGNGLNSRSSSYMSITKLEQSERMNRKRSSSELSIGESPSLQSLEVIKTILNSRKNSLANSSDGETKAAIGEVINHIEKSPKQVQPKKEPEHEVKVKDTTAVTSSPHSEAVAAEGQSPQKELPKVYRYSGPPSINFGTWSERPKAKVAIKNEGDYIFGGKNSGRGAVTNASMEINSNSVPRNYRASMPAVAHQEKSATPPIVAPKPVTVINRMGIPEKEFKVPITVKPIKDVVIENVSQPEDPKSSLPQERCVKTWKPTTTTVTVNGTQDVVVKRVNAHTSTLPRIGGGANRFSTPASGQASLTRSISITQLEASQKPINQETTAAPFGQNTLRKTGLKDKILAEEKKPELVSESKAKPPTPAKVLTNGNVNRGSAYITHTNILATPTKPLQSAKLELKLQTKSNAFVNQKSEPQTPKIAPVTLKAIPSPPVAPKPPTPPSWCVSAKSKSSGGVQSPCNEDPRNQLLEAIRNFKKDELKRN